MAKLQQITRHQNYTHNGPARKPLQPTFHASSYQTADISRNINFPDPQNAHRIFLSNQDLHFGREDAQSGVKERGHGLNIKETSTVPDNEVPKQPRLAKLVQNLKNQGKSKKNIDFSVF
mgnify:FL=1